MEQPITNQPLQTPLMQPAMPMQQQMIQQPVMQQQMQPAYAGGGGVPPNPVSSFMQGVTLGDVVITALCVAGLLLIINYHRGQIKHSRSTNQKQEEMQQQLTEVRDNVQKAMGDTYEFY